MAATRRTTPTTAALATIAALALTGCNGSGSAAPAPSPTATVAALSPTPSPSPSPSPTPTEVLPANDVRDPVEALEAIVYYRDHLFEHPDPDKLELIYAERCDCYERILPLLEQVKSKGQRFEIPRERRFEFIEVEERHGPFAQIRYATDEPPTRLLDADGTVLEERDGSDEMHESIALLVSEGGRWRVVAFA